MTTIVCGWKEEVLLEAEGVEGLPGFVLLVGREGANRAGRDRPNLAVGVGQDDEREAWLGAAVEVVRVTRTLTAAVGALAAAAEGTSRAVALMTGFEGR